MKLSKSDFKGTKEVWLFTLKQMLKNKTNLISLFILLILAILSGPFFLLSNGGSTTSAGMGENTILTADKEGNSEITSVYCVNETNYKVDCFQFSEAIGIEKEKVQEMDSSFLEDWQSKLQEKEVIVSISSKEDGFYIQIFCLKEDGLEADCRKLQQEAESMLQIARYQALGISEEQVAVLLSSYQVETDTLLEYQQGETEDFGTSFLVQYIYSILVLILCVMSVSYIVRSVIEEKDSKLVELLMVSVKPLALLAGKILAVMVFVFGMMLMLIGVMLASIGITGMMMGYSGIDMIQGGLGVNIGSLNIGVLTVVIILLFLFSGYCMASLLSGIAGVSCSSMEDMESANMSIVFIILAGYLGSTFISGMGNQVAAVISCFIPVLSIFCAPVQYILGNVNLLVLGIAWVVQMIVNGFLAMFCARIYKALIFYKGNRMSWKALFQLELKGKAGE